MESESNLPKLNESGDFTHQENGISQEKMVSHTASSASPSPLKYIRVELTETPTQFLLLLPSEPKIIPSHSHNRANHPISIRNANTFSFISDSDQHETFCQSSLASEAEEFRRFRDHSDGRKMLKKKKLRHHSCTPSCITVLHEDPPLYRCNICQKTFKAKVRFKYHVFCGKDDADKPYKCEYEWCGRGFADKLKYEYHVRSHKGDVSFVCTYCGKGFHSFVLFNRHLLVHSDQKPFKCSICGLAFKAKHNLTKHIQRMHHQSKEVAKELSNNAGLDYLKSTTNDPIPDDIPASRIESVVISAALMNSDAHVAHVSKEVANDCYLPINISVQEPMCTRTSQTGMSNEKQSQSTQTDEYTPAPECLQHFQNTIDFSEAEALRGVGHKENEVVTSDLELISVLDFINVD